MNKLAVFNVWWAMAAYCEIWWKKIIVDIGTKNWFSPINDFLQPLAIKENRAKSTIKWQETKYHIDQLIISHPHKDHLSDIKNFHQYFYPEFVTTPNDNAGMASDETLNRDLFLGSLPIDSNTDFLRKNFITWRTPPLKSIVQGFEIYYVPPKKIEVDLAKADYANNTSLICIITIWSNKVMLPWDIMPTAINWMMSNHCYSLIPWSQTKTSFENAIKKRGINILVAPHHWLKSAFCSTMMNLIKDELKLIIIPEKPTTADDVRQVDNRYYSGEFGSWIDVYDYENQKRTQFWSMKTSVWHIVITPDQIAKVREPNNLVNLFSSLQ